MENMAKLTESQEYTYRIKKIHHTEIFPFIASILFVQTKMSNPKK